MKKYIQKIDPFFLFAYISIGLFLLYEKYLGTIIIQYNIPFVPHMRTPEAAVMKYLPLIIILLIISLLLKHLYQEKKA